MFEGDTCCRTFAEEGDKLTQSCGVALLLREWHCGDPQRLWTTKQTHHDLATPPHLFLWTRPISKLNGPTLPLNLARSSSLWCWSITREILFDFSQRASWSPTFTSRDRVRIVAEVNNSNTVIKKVKTIIFKNFHAWIFESAIVVSVVTAEVAEWSQHRWHPAVWRRDTYWRTALAPFCVFSHKSFRHFVICCIEFKYFVYAWIATEGD